MRRLILIRHAKSDWGGPALPDHERPLNARGRAAAAQLGAWLAAGGYVPGKVLCSDAERTRETWERIALSLPANIAVEYLASLYDGGVDAMLAALRGAADECVLMLGHNPGIGWMAAELVSAPPYHLKFEQYPTAATLIAEFDINGWHALRPRTGTVRDFVTPPDLD